jgi:predicted O-methyltransferase YrrM
MRIPRSARRAARSASHAQVLFRTPLYAKPGHFYSPISTPEDARRATTWRALTEVPGVDLRDSEQCALAVELGPMWQTTPGPRYSPDNDQFSPPDAVVLQSLLSHLRPRRVLEVGSGWSTAVTLDTADRLGLDLELTCVEPYPDRLLARLLPEDATRLRLQRCGAQSVPVAQFEELEPGDILFIDSTHVLKAGSDVVWLFLHVLPRLRPGVHVHVHDIFWPFEYPPEWLHERRDWNELYLLRAMLTGTRMWEIELFSSWLWDVHPELVPTELRHGRPGSIWLRKVA